MNVNKAAAALLPLVLVTLPMAPAPAAQEQPSGPLRWVADWGERRCALGRTAANATPVLALRLRPGSTQVELFFPDRPPPIGAADDATATLVFGDGSRSDVALDTRSPTEPASWLSIAADEALLDQLARSSSVKLVHAGETLADVPLPGVGAAIAALRRCAESALTDWGVDVAAQAALRRKPQRIPRDQSWIHAADYPYAALRRRRSGEVITRLTVDAAGRVRQCAVVVSSGDEDLDQTTCHLFAMRGRYVPALDSEGRPTAAATIEAVRWMLPP